MQINPRRLHTGLNVEKTPFDFVVLYEGKLTAFDVKECSSDRFRPPAAHQIKALDSINKNSGEGFFLVHFTQRHDAYKLVKFAPWQCVKSCRAEEGTPTTIDILNILSTPKEK